MGWTRQYRTVKASSVCCRAVLLSRDRYHTVCDALARFCGRPKSARLREDLLYQISCRHRSTTGAERKQQALLVSSSSYFVDSRFIFRCSTGARTGTRTVTRTASAEVRSSGRTPPTLDANLRNYTACIFWPVFTVAQSTSVSGRAAERDRPGHSL